MTIKHYPVFNTDEIERIYTEKDGVPVRYVCTTDLKASDVPVDVFYRETPHPQFGNHYFGLYINYYSPENSQIMITNADMVEELEFGMIESDNTLYYSQSHHDCKFLPNGEMIDGGRAYIRSSVPTVVYKVIDGEMKEMPNG